MSIIQRVRLYNFKELDDRIQKEIKDNTETLDYFNELGAAVEKQVKEFLEMQGILFKKLEFSGFNSRMDGARISCTIYGDSSVGFLRKKLWLDTQNEKEFMEEVAEKCNWYKNAGGSLWKKIHKENPSLINRLKLYMTEEDEEGQFFIQITVYPISEKIYK